MASYTDSFLLLPVSQRKNTSVLVIRLDTTTKRCKMGIGTDKMTMTASSPDGFQREVKIAYHNEINKTYDDLHMFLLFKIQTFSQFKMHTSRRTRIKCSRPRWLSWMRRPTGDQEVAGSTPAEVGNILSWRLIMKYFLQSFSPFSLIQEGQLSVSCERMCIILVNRLED